jgi:hypothetical protein
MWEPYVQIRNYGLQEWPGIRSNFGRARADRDRRGRLEGKLVQARQDGCRMLGVLKSKGKNPH